MVYVLYCWHRNLNYSSREMSLSVDVLLPKHEDQNSYPQDLYKSQAWGKHVCNPRSWVEASDPRKVGGQPTYKICKLQAAGLVRIR